MDKVQLAITHLRQYWRVYAPCGLVLVALTAFGWLSNRVEDASIQRHGTQAEEFDNQSREHEGRANAAGDEADAIEAQRKETERRYTTKKGQLAESRKRLTERKRQYDEAQSGNAPVDASGSLDERETRLLTKLRALYPGAVFKLVTTRGADN